jgi:16S rRNA (uracil1498-N3)-methyltransferase
MRRFFVDEIKDEEPWITITGSEARHITKVLRMSPGDRLILMDQQGKRCRARIESVSVREVRVFLEAPLPAPPAPPVEISLCQALLKSNAMDYMVQKASELGVASILPFQTPRTVVKVTRDGSGARLRHWREIARNAAKQSDKDRPARIAAATSFGELITRFKEEEALRVILWENEEARDLKDLLRSTENPGRVIAVIGPEGGFSEEEVSFARSAGFLSVSLGARILRAETAAIALAVVVQYEWGDLSKKR